MPASRRFRASACGKADATSGAAANAPIAGIRDMTHSEAGRGEMVVSEAVYGPLLTACFTGLFGWLLVKGFRSGTMGWGYFGLHLSGERSSEPSKFWAATVLLAIPFFLGCIATVGMILWPHGIGS